jgi:hypothetical protein
MTVAPDTTIPADVEKVVVTLQSYARLEGNDILGNKTITTVIYTYSSLECRCDCSGH